jgi:hypothetical protein
METRSAFAGTLHRPNMATHVTLLMCAASLALLLQNDFDDVWELCRA